MSPGNGKAIAVTCSCGGWVMVSALGYGHDVETFREAGKLVEQGYTLRSPLTVEEVRAMAVCKHHGDCLTGSTQLEAIPS